MTMRTRQRTAIALQIGIALSAVLWTFGTSREHTYPKLPAPLAMAYAGPHDDQLRQYEILSGQARRHLESGGLQAALDTYQQALRLSRAQGNRASEASAELGIAKAKRRLGRLEEALNASERAMTLVEGIQSSEVPSWRRATYGSAVEILMELSQRKGQRDFAARAFEITERARWYADLPHRPASRPLGFQEVQALLDNETLLLSFWLDEERSFLWIVGNDSFESYVLPSRATLENAALRAHSTLSESRRRVPRVSSELALMSLGNLTLAPAAGTLGEKRLVIISDGALQSIPFAALPDPSSLPSPLILTHEIVMLPSASVLPSLRHTAERRPKPSGLLAMIADPVFGADDPRFSKGTPLRAADIPESSRAGSALAVSSLRRLPYSGVEVEEILRLAPSSSPNLRALGFAATRELATSGVLSRYRILHFATHGVFDNGHPDRSGIVLSMVDRDGQSLDGILRSSEIRSLQLSTDLVVLSACQTGLGRDLDPRGREALLSSFLDAGASRVVASLWGVDDFATSELMKHFYRGILKEGREPADALRQAQISMLRDPRWSSPFYWAGFIIEGDWRER